MNKIFYNLIYLFQSYDKYELSLFHDQIKTKNKISTNNIQMKKVKVCAIQLSTEICNTQKNIDKITLLLREASKNGAKIAVLPEACVNGYLSQDFKTNWQVKGRPIEKK